MAWALLSIAGILEIAFAFFMKSSVGFTRLTPALLTVATGLSSVFLLSISLRTLPFRHSSDQPGCAILARRLDRHNGGATGRHCCNRALGIERLSEH